MAKSISLQIRALLIKNFQCSWRNRELLSEILLPFIASIFISLKEQLSFLTIFAPMFLAIAINSSARSLLIHLVEEKSERYKETQKIMGMKQRSYTIGWILYGYIKTIMVIKPITKLLQSTFILILAWVLFNYIINKGKFGFTVPFINIMAVYWIYAAASLNFSLMLSTLFSSPKLASEVTTFMTVLSTLLTFLLFLERLQTSSLFYYGLSIFPASSISFAFISVLQPKPGNFFPSANVNLTYPLHTAAIQLAVETCLYFLLYFYLDQVFPNEYGLAKHPLFFIKDLFNKNKNTVQDVEIGLLNTTQIDDQDSSSAIYHQQIQNNKKPTVVIRNLVKQFGEFTAVDKLSINLYPSEILCLLGHNGAGKTTTISVLTGLLSKTAGQVRMCGYDLALELDKIREIVGICNQRDVLYDELTVREQLSFMGRIKGLDGLTLEKDIDGIIQTTELVEEQNKITKELSGGNKRKLSLAQALIGGSSVIFLDEPTSGMDAMSRRVIWSILERIKNENRTLVLTTHHLDEAEILADRIAIMAAGKLLACGTSEFIKVNFGEGYQMQLSVMNQSISKMDVKTMVQQELPQAVLDPQSSSNTLLYLVPFKAKSKLLVFFEKMESRFRDDVQVSLKMNSLEDAFINIGMDEEKFIQKAKQSVGINDQEDDHYENENRMAEQNQQLYVPQCLREPAQYIFKQQFLAIFYRKWYTTIRTFSNYVAIVIPFALIVIGTLIINQISFGNLTEAMENYLRLVFISIFVILAFCFNSSIFIMLPVLERETNLKYTLTVMGCRVLPYWAGTLAFDYILFFAFVIIFVIFSFIMQLTFVTDHLLPIIFIFIAFGLAYVAFSYFAGVWLYTKTSSAMKTFPLFNFFIVYCGPWNVWGICSFIQQSHNLAWMDYVLYFIELVGVIFSPFYAFNLGFQNIIKIENLNPDKQQKQPVFISTNPWFYGAMLVFQFLLFSYLTVWLESRKYDKVQQYKTQGERIDVKKSLRADDGVDHEVSNVQNSTAFPIKVMHLQKQYENGYLAIKEVTLGVEPKQILGLLGPNGAGKSSMFNILTSLINKTSGSVQIKNIEINRGETEIFRDVGICPQFDSIWENLTPVEHLYLFGRMKGLSGKDLDESVTYFIKTMQLDEYVKRKAGRLSGGNKRKLCVSDALIGGPCIQFFDEPSTGVDPIARRFLWRTLKQGVQLRDSSVVITTHTMDEAESLCDRIAILVNGQIYCIGSPQELRDKFGEGYNITMKGLKSNQESEVVRLIQECFKSARVLEERRQDYFTVHVCLDFYTMHLQVPTEEFKFYRAFELLETELKQNGLIEDFSINQSSLESVFLYFSQQQSENI